MEMDAVIITGASRGIGRSIALRLAKKGYAVIVNYAASAGVAEALVREIEEGGGTARAFKADVADFAQAEALVQFAKEEFGGLYGLVNNAGINKDQLLLRMSEQDFDDVLRVNLKGAFNMMKHASALMFRKRRGRIVSIGSIAGVMGNFGQANYAASKAGLIGMSKTCARELASRNITVNVVAPGLVDSDMTQAMDEGAREALIKSVPMQRMGNASEVAALVEFLLGGEASYITGQTLVVDGGLCM